MIDFCVIFVFFVVFYVGFWYGIGGVVYSVVGVFVSFWVNWFWVFLINMVIVGGLYLVLCELLCFVVMFGKRVFGFNVEFDWFLNLFKVYL